MHATVVPGKKAIRLTWSPPTEPIPVGLAYDVLLDGEVVGTTLLTTSYTFDQPGLVVGRTYDVGVRATLGLVTSDEVSVSQQLYIAPVTPVQASLIATL